MLKSRGSRRTARRSSGRGVLVGSLCSRTGSSLFIQQLEQFFQGQSLVKQDKNSLDKSEGRQRKSRHGFALSDVTKSLHPVYFIMKG